MSDKLWNVEIVTEVIVKADSKEEAEQTARKARDLMLDEEFDFRATSAMIEWKGEKRICLPTDWDGETTPYGAEGGETIDQILEAAKSGE